MCQHIYLRELGEEKWYLKKLKYFIIHYVFKHNKEKRARFKERLLKEGHRENQIEQFNTGDIVRIKPKATIDAVLDFDGKYNRCQFMDEMYQYCGKTYPIQEKVDYFYDAGLSKLCKCKDLYILDGMSCQGKKGVPFSICDLNCNFFWHGMWIEKI
jgi:hypothetical protein